MRPTVVTCVAAAMCLLGGLLQTVAVARTSENSAPRSERPEDVWAYLRDAAAVAGAQPDKTRHYEGVLGQSHRVFIFTPSDMNAATSYPGVVLFHGGAWREGSPVQFYRQARAIADAGFVVVLPEYSIRDEDGSSPRDALLDAFRAWSEIRINADEMGIDASQLFAGGASAGGQLAAALATVPPPPGTTDHTHPIGLILFNPVIDNGPEGYGYSRVKEYWKSFSPLQNIGERHPRTLIMVGDSDPLLPVTTADAYCSQVKRTGSSCEVMVFAEAGHAWFNFDPAGYEGTLRAALEFLTVADND